MYHISFQQIYYFLTLVHTLSFTDAAQMLYISQPALSKQITALENELGFTLFERTKRSVTITPEGQLLAKRWAQLQDALNASVYDAKLLNQQTAGCLRIGCADTFEVDDELLAITNVLHQTHPEIRIDIESHGFKNLHRLLYADELDVVFIPAFELPHYKDVEILNYLKLELGIAVPVTNPLAQKDFVTISDLKHEPIVTLSLRESPLGATKVKNYFKKYHITPNIVKEAANLQSLTLALKNGVGCTICHNKIKSSRIRMYTLEDQPYDCNIHAVWKADYTSAELELFKTILKKYAQT